MSQDVDVIRRAFQTWNDQALEEWKAVYHDDVVIVPPAGWPEGETTADLDSWLTQAMRLTDSWEEQRIEVDELREAGGHVLSVFRWVTRGKGSGIDLVTPMASISTVRDGKIARQEYYLSAEEALEVLDRTA